MENDMSQEPHAGELGLNRESLSHIRNISKWALFLSILGFVVVGLMVLIGIGAIFAISLIARQSDLRGLHSMFLVLLYPIMGLIYFFPIYFLYRFAVYAKQGVQTLNANAITLALGYLNKHYTYIAALTIVALALIPIVILIMISIVIPMMLRAGTGV